MSIEGTGTLPAFSEQEYVWLVAKSLIRYVGSTDIVSFINNNYYFKVNLSQNLVEEKVSAALDLTRYPNSYDGFLARFAENLFPAENSDSIVLAFNRNALLRNYEERRFFWSNEFALVSAEKTTKQFSAYCQLFLKDGDVYASILFIDRNWLHNKALVRKNSSEFDRFTGMYNRAYGTRLCIEWLQYHPEEPSAVIMIGIDGFDQMKSAYGQKVMNAIVGDLTGRLREHFDNDRIISRFSEGEFEIFLMYTSAQKALTLLNALASSELSVEGPGGAVVPYYISGGYAMYPEDSRDFSELCRMAEIALDISGRNAKDSTHRFSRDMLSKNKRKLGFNMMDIANGIPGAIIVYRADEDEEILYANGAALTLFECETFDEFQRHTNGSFRGLVYPEDYERVEESIRRQLDESDNTGRLDYVRFRIITKTGVIKEIDDFGHLVASPYYGDIFYVFLYDAEKAEGSRKRFQV